MNTMESLLTVARMGPNTLTGMSLRIQRERRSLRVKGERAALPR